jgi:hypothetical protein
MILDIARLGLLWDDEWDLEVGELDALHFVPNDEAAIDEVIVPTYTLGG